MPAPAPLWSSKVSVEEVPEGGRHVSLKADAAVRAALAAQLGLRDLPRLEARFDVSRQGRDGLAVVGEVSATVGQNCVVTLDPVENEVVEKVDLVFLPPSGPARRDEADDSPDAGDAPETLENGKVDLGALATEFLALGIDPYPRKEGVVFEAVEKKDPADHPFAALAALKGRRE